MFSTDVLRGKWHASWQALLLILTVGLSAFLVYWKLGVVHILHDEAWAANYLLDPTQHFPKSSPLLFRLTVDFLVTLVGSSETSLRFLPATIAVVTLPLFYLLLLRMAFDRTTALLSTILLAFCPSFLTFARFFHHYSLEVLCCVSLLLLAEWYLSSPQWKRFLPLLLVSLLCFLLSNTTILVLPSVMVSLALQWVATRRRWDLWSTLAYTLITGGTFVSYYLFHYLRFFPLGSRTYTGYWHQYFLPPWPPLTTLTSWLHALSRLFTFYFSGWWWPPLLLLLGCLTLLGAVAFALKDLRRFLVFLCLPILAVSVAALLQRYPFGERPCLFLLPLFLLCAGYGLRLLLSAVTFLSRSETLLSVLASLLLMGAAFVPAWQQEPIRPKDLVVADVGSMLEYYQASRELTDRFANLGQYAIAQLHFYAGEKVASAVCEKASYQNTRGKVDCIIARYPHTRIWWYWAKGGSKKLLDPEGRGLFNYLQQQCHVLGEPQIFENAFLVLTDTCKAGEATPQSGPSPAASSARSK